MAGATGLGFVDGPLGIVAGTTHRRFLTELILVWIVLDMTRAALEGQGLVFAPRMAVHTPHFLVAPDEFKATLAIVFKGALFPTRRRVTGVTGLPFELHTMGVVFAVTDIALVGSRVPGRLPILTGMTLFARGALVFSGEFKAPHIVGKLDGLKILYNVALLAAPLGKEPAVFILMAIATGLVCQGSKAIFSLVALAALYLAVAPFERVVCQGRRMVEFRVCVLLFPSKHIVTTVTLFQSAFGKRVHVFVTVAALVGL